MKFKNIFLTGSTGTLGRAIVSSQLFRHLLTPSRQELDITVPATIKAFFDKNRVDAIIHCAALARIAQCELNPAAAMEANIIGTCNLVAEVLGRENTQGEKIRFIHISTDGVYTGTRGNYAEQDTAIPYNKYGWTKLGAECAVNILSNFCIIRTSFFDPHNIRFDCSATDAYSSKVPLVYLVKAIKKMLEGDFIGTINIGGERKSDYERYKEFKPQLAPCLLEDILKNIPAQIAKDTSMNLGLWAKFQKKKNKARQYVPA